MKVTEIEKQKMLDACPPEIMKKIMHDLDVELEANINKGLKRFGKKEVSELTNEEKQKMIDMLEKEQIKNYYKGELANLEHKLQNKNRAIFLLQIGFCICVILSVIQALGGFDWIKWH